MNVMQICLLQGHGPIKCSEYLPDTSSRLVGLNVLSNNVTHTMAEMLTSGLWKVQISAGAPPLSAGTVLLQDLMEKETPTFICVTEYTSVWEIDTITVSVTFLIQQSFFLSSRFCTLFFPWNTLHSTKHIFHVVAYSFNTTLLIDNLFGSPLKYRVSVISKSSSVIAVKIN